MRVTAEEKALLYALRTICWNWDINPDYRGLLLILSAMREKGMMRALDLLLLPGRFRAIVMYILKNREAIEEGGLLDG